MQNTTLRRSLYSQKPLFFGFNWQFSRQRLIGVILLVALLAFEVFNFDTTQFALASLLTDVSFAGMRWAAILAFAFCAIDFAGLTHLFTPANLRQEKSEIYFLLGAWLLGATMNALMTWWAVTLIIIDHPLVGNEVLTHTQLLHIVPIFVAVLVWLTRILFIGALSVAGEQLFGIVGEADEMNEGARQAQAQRSRKRVPQPNVTTPRPVTTGTHIAPKSQTRRPMTRPYAPNRSRPQYAGMMAKQNTPYD